MTDKPVLIVDDDKSICKTLKLHFKRKGIDVIITNSGMEGLRELDSLPSAIIILDIRLPDANGLELLKEIQKRGDGYFTIIITAFPDMESTVKAVQSGVGEYIHKPLDIAEIDSAIEKANNFFANLKYQEMDFVPIPEYKPSEGIRFIGKSPIMKELFKTVGMISMSKATVHITGESGTGKELVARSIHQHGSNRDAPFISVNCSAIVETLLESELFGHVKGAFTGASSNKEGKFSLAKNGTIFLDEVGEMNFNLQAKLLRVLQEREFERVGGEEKLKAECRMLSATNRNLEQMVKEGSFREDLYYRLKVINIHLPPLRDRREDIQYLLLHFIAKTSKEINRSIRFISQEAIDFLVSHSWKGNVREIENMVTHVVTMTQDESLTKANFASIINNSESGRIVEHLLTAESRNNPMPAPNGYNMESLNEIEKRHVRKTLEHTKWHKGKACRILGISRPRLDRKIKKYGINPSRSYATENMTSEQ